MYRGCRLISSYLVARRSSCSFRPCNLAVYKARSGAGVIKVLRLTQQARSGLHCVHLAISGRNFGLLPTQDFLSDAMEWECCGPPGSAARTLDDAVRHVTEGAASDSYKVDGDVVRAWSTAGSIQNFNPQ